jgi:hypothetical protein
MADMDVQQMMRPPGSSSIGRGPGIIWVYNLTFSAAVLSCLKQSKEK